MWKTENASLPLSGSWLKEYVLGIGVYVLGASTSAASAWCVASDSAASAHARRLADAIMLI